MANPETKGGTSPDQAETTQVGGQVPNDLVNPFPIIDRGQAYIEDEIAKAREKFGISPGQQFKIPGETPDPGPGVRLDPPRGQPGRFHREPPLHGDGPDFGYRPGPR